MPQQRSTKRADDSPGSSIQMEWRCFLTRSMSRHAQFEAVVIMRIDFSPTTGSWIGGSGYDE